MTTIEMISKKGEVKFFTVWQHYEESFIEQMREQIQNIDQMTKKVQQHQNHN